MAVGREMLSLLKEHVEMACELGVGNEGCGRLSAHKCAGCKAQALIESLDKKDTIEMPAHFPRTVPTAFFVEAFRKNSRLAREVLKPEDWEELRRLFQLCRMIRLYMEVSMLKRKNDAEEIKAILARVYSGEYNYEKMRPELAEVYGKNLPPWSELTDEQKANVKAEQERYQKEMQAFGEAISNGTIQTGLTVSRIKL